MSPPQSLAGLRVLVLEDEILIAMDVEQLCRDSGAEHVVIASTLPEVSGELPAFDVAVIDVMLAGVSTLPFAKSLRERGMPIVFATGYARTSEGFEEFPDVPIVGKPYSSEELVGAIARAAGR